MLTEPILIEGVKRTNAVIVCPNQQAGFVFHNIYAINIDRGNRNCYNYIRFGHLIRNCRNQEIEGRIEERRRLEYGNRNNEQSNLNGEENLIILN